MRALHAVLLACILLSVTAGVATVAAAPPPEHLCGVCPSDPDSSSPGTGIEGATERGTLDVTIDDSGDSRWTERVPVNASAAERYRTNHSALESAVETAWARYHVAAGDVRDVNASVKRETVVVSYAVDDLARRGVGDAWVVDYFYAGGTATRYDLGADRVTLHPPDGTAVRTVPSDATLADGSVTWSGADPGPTTSDFDPRTLVTYGPGGVTTAVAAYASIAAAVGPRVVHDAALGGLVPALVVGGVALVGARLDRPVVPGALRRRASHLGETLGVRDLTDATIALGVVGVAVALVGVVLGTGPTVANAAALGGAAASYTAVVAGVRRLGSVSTRTLLAVAVAGATGCGVATWALTRSPYAVVPAAFTLAALAFLPLGHALERGATGAVAASAVLAIAGPFLAVAAVAPLYVFGMSPILYGLFVLPTTLLAAGAGYPLSLVGRRLAADG